MGVDVAQKEAGHGEVQVKSLNIRTGYVIPSTAPTPGAGTPLRNGPWLRPPGLDLAGDLIENVELPLVVRTQKPLEPTVTRIFVQGLAKLADDPVQQT